MSLKWPNVKRGGSATCVDPTLNQAVCSGIAAHRFVTSEHDMRRAQRKLLLISTASVVRVTE